MNKKNMILFILWVTFCAALIGFSIIHIIIQGQVAKSKELINIVSLLIGGIKK